MENIAARIRWSDGSTNDHLAGPAVQFVRLGRNRAVTTDDVTCDAPGGFVYNAQPNAVPDRSFTKFAWTTTWDVSPPHANQTASLLYLMVTELTGAAPPPTYYLSTSVSGRGGASGTIAGCDGYYVAGASFSCTITPATGSQLSGPPGGTCGTLTQSGSVWMGIMPASNCTVTAAFQTPITVQTGVYGKFCSPGCMQQ